MSVTMHREKTPPNDPKKFWLRCNDCGSMMTTPGYAKRVHPAICGTRPPDRTADSIVMTSEKPGDSQYELQYGGKINA